MMMLVLQVIKDKTFKALRMDKVLHLLTALLCFALLSLTYFQHSAHFLCSFALLFLLDGDGDGHESEVSEAALDAAPPSGYP